MFILVASAVAFGIILRVVAEGPAVCRILFFPHAVRKLLTLSSEYLLQITK
jgi:hypothetical protein